MTFLSPAPWRERLQKLDSNQRRYWGTVSIGALLLVAWILFLRAVEHPWEGDTAKRVAAGKKLIVADYVQIYFYWVGVITAVLWGALLLTSRWWWQWTHDRGGSRFEQEGKFSLRAVGVPRREWLAIAGIIVFAGIIRVPTMDRALNRDEQDNLRRSIHGYHQYSKDGSEIGFRKATWQDAFFENKLANNPVLFGVAAKASLGMWRTLSGAEEGFLNRPALRTPALVAGLASIGAMWWLLVLLGRHKAALVAAGIAAVHPFHIEYSTQARGYGLVMLFSVLAIIFVLLALRHLRWRYWMGYALSLFAVLYAFPGAVYFVVTLGLGVSLLLLRGWKRGDWLARMQFCRMALVGLVAGVLYVQMMSPLIPQAQADFKSWEQIPLDERWRFYTYTKLVSGATFVDRWETAKSDHGELGVVQYVATQLATEEPLFVTMTFVVVPLLLALGIRRFWALGGLARVIALVTFAAPLLAFCHHHFITNFYYYYWYLCYSVPFAIMLGAVGLTAAGGRLASVMRVERRELAVKGTLAAVFVGLFVVTTFPGEPGRSTRRTVRDNEPNLVQRGSSNWILYPCGRMLKLPVGDTVPQEFPG